MKVSDLDLDSQSINFLHSEGLSELYPPQAECIEKGLFDDKKSFLISIPTASGKTLIAMLAILSHISKHKTKVVYLSPLRALASEKFEEFKKLEKLGLDRKIKVAISTGDSNSSDNKLDDADVIILTNETMDANMAFERDWIYEIGLVISDEIHLIGDSTRGPTLEMILTRLVTGFLGKTPPKIIGLSATISNSNELAEWLKCELVESEWRPVPLVEAVYSNHTIMTSQDSEYSEGNLNEKRESRHTKPAIGLGLETIENGDQCLIFTMTRKSSVATATEAGINVVKTLVENQKKELQKISKKILPKDNEDETKLIKKLADTVKNGAAFHHAGLDQRCRTIIETEFRNGHIKLLTSTPTLAAGVNLPARRVVIPSVMRYTQNGLDKISILEYKQMCGRAGRPQYDNEGESILIAKGSPYDFIEHYIDGEPEPLESQILEEDSSLRIHLLSLIKTSSVFDPISKEKISKFFSHTFGGYQIDDDDNLEEKISKQLKKLKEYDMIIGEDSFKPTKFGEKVFWLRIDPKTAFEITGYIENYVQGAKHTFGVLHMITNLPEFYPQIPYDINEIIIKNEHEKLYTEQKFQDDNCFKSLLILHHWIDAMTFSDMSNNFDAEPGDIFYMQQNAGQLAYAVREIARYWKNQILVDELDIIRKRIRYGVPEKYLELVEIKNVGRVRAKNLYHAGLRTRQSLKDVSLENLSKIDKIGVTIAKSIKSQLENSKK
ncbi:DEAD/DEAH box helicase [Candidatus Nitrosopelagicus sp.]|nr:DEAD/DEAH box helicase [Candidatus Nitrosopelagicus sp.]